MSAHEGKGGLETTGERGKRVILNWLEFSILRHYAMDLQVVEVEPGGAVTLTLTLRVPSYETQ